MTVSSNVHVAAAARSTRGAIAAALAFVLLAGPVALHAQQPAAAADPSHALLDKLTGHWVMRGTIGKKATTHDVDAAWVLKGGYLQIHEVGREQGGYEAWLYITWDAKNGMYACLWLDNTGTTTFNGENIGHAKPAADRLALIFNDPDGSIDHTTFAYDKAKDAWTWTIDAEAKGKTTRFADLTLTRQ
jgi:hypothetical protein